MIEWTRERLGDILLRSGLVTESQLEQALEVQSAGGGRLGKILAERGVISEEQLAETLAVQKKLDLVDLTEYDIEKEVARLIPSQVAVRYQVLPLAVRDGNLVVAMANPLDVEAVDTLRVMTGYDVQPVVATESDVAWAIRQYLESEETAIRAAASAVSREPLRQEEPEIETETVPVVTLVNKLVDDAIEERASDIHFEPQTDCLRVRYRIDGVLHEVARIPKNVEPSLISRLKIMADADIAEKRLPQDGHFNYAGRGREVDVRVAILPTMHGENVTLRLLSGAISLLKLSQLGIEEDMLERLRALLSRPHGSLLVTGPTGSGKTTTMYASLNELNTPERKIMTIEDPVEYQIPGIVQTRVNTRIGLTFAAGLRTVVRCDPDIVLIGEIRDLETAQIAVRSALTGHLVLSSLHANDAPSALTTLVDMGIPSYIISSAVNGVVAQRLARRLCGRCKEQVEPEPRLVYRANIPDEDLEGATMCAPRGCKHCAQTGFSGRIAVSEIMPVSEAVAQLCVKSGSSEVIREAAIAEGMRTMRQDGIMKALAGVTSLEEIMRVVV
ncbi:MAG: type II secretion system protein GspE [Actinobacteria bacterium]|nr:MAG: type II secretion system protein GspE [Actinomycetota bacterium]